MTDERPRPQYGEYATPAEVAEARGPLPAVEPAPAPVAQRPASDVPPRPTVARPSVRPVSRWDRPFTIALLAAGVVNVIGSISVYLDLARSLRTAFAQLGATGLKLDGPEIPAIGVAMVVADSVLIVAAIILAALLIRRGRRAIWVPIVAFAVHGIVINLLVLPVVLNDPGYATLLHNLN